MPEVSIVILTKNEEKFIADILEAVFNQDTRYSFEVIVIDSGSRDKTLEIAKKYPVNLIQIPAEEFGHGKTRNLGAVFAEGRYIVFLNGDALPKNISWLSNLLLSFSIYDKVAGAYSKMYPHRDCNPLDARDILADNYLFNESKKLKYIKSFFEYNQMHREEKRRFVSFQTISCAIDKKILLENPFADIKFGEDLEWSKRMLEMGFKIIYEPNSEVIHSHNIHCSIIKTIKRYFDDARLSQRLLNRWSFMNLLKWLVVIVFESRQDAVYICRLKRNLFYKLSWIIYSPIVRMAELFGILFGTFPFLPSSLADKLSLVGEIKRK
jgi:rhamnosyltransferase